MLDEVVGPEWRLQREEEQEIEAESPDMGDLDSWFPRN